MRFKRFLIESDILDLVAAVKQFANSNYENGWDIVVETMTDEEIAEEIAGSKTPEEAIKKMAIIVDLYNDKRQEIQSTAF